MNRYVVRFVTTIEVAVTVEIDPGVAAFSDEDRAADAGWQKAEEYLQTLGNHRDVVVDASLDGIGAEAVERVQS